MWIESAQLNMQVMGEGAAVLMVHGAGGESGLWSELAARLAPHARAAALDLSGHGKSPRRAHAHTLDTYIQDILSAVDALGGPVVLAGHSMGGALAMCVALEHPDAVRGLALAATGARLRVLPALIQQFESPDPAAAVSMMSGAAFAPGAPHALVQEYAESLKRADPRVVVQDFRICDSFDIMPRLAQIRVPSLILCGDKDNLTPFKYSAYLHENIPGSELVQLPGCGHMLMLEAPGECADRILGFVRALG
jgi:pimeloyl-ACP methyl ester carboxylesterase